MNKFLLVIALFLFLSSIVFALELPSNVLLQLGANQQTALRITLLGAFIVGFLSFTSPCSFAVVPAYLSFMFKERKRAVLMSSVFSLGMIVALSLMGFVASFFKDFFFKEKLYLGPISGIFLIIFGLMLFFNKGLIACDFKKNHSHKKSFFGIFSLGFFFTLGWSPCLMPVLFGIIFLAAEMGKTFLSTLLMAVYGLGVATPMILISLLADRFDWQKNKFFTGTNLKLFGRNFHTYNIFGGLILIFLGVIMIIFKGTFFFQNTIPEYLPWTMNFFDYVNTIMVENSFFTSTLANVIGGVLIVLIIFLIYKNFEFKR